MRGFEGSDHRGIGRFARFRGVRCIVVAAAAFGLALSACVPSGPVIVMPSPRASLEGNRPASPEPVAPPAALPPSASVTGDVRFLESPEGPVDLGPIVVSLIRRGGAGAPAGADSTVVVASRGETFAPGLAAVPADRRAVFANEGPLAHVLFSADLAGTRIDVPPDGHSEAVRIPPIGPVRFYCSLHSEETFVLYAGYGRVAVVEPGERFSFAHLDGGRYTLAIWSELVEGPVREIVVDGLSRTVAPIWIDPDLVRSRDRGMADR